MTIVVTHTTPADSSFSTEGAAAWNANHALSGVGTMAEQDANNVAITGGSINGASIGAAAPGAATFTTLTATGQTSLGGAAGANNFRVLDTAGSVNYWNVRGGDGATTSPRFSTDGTGTNIAGQFATKGTGAFQFLTGGTNEQLRITNTASAVNYVQVTGAATGSGVVVSAQGSDTNVSIGLRSKGTGEVALGTGGTFRAFSVTGTSGANYLQATSAAANQEPVLSAQGSDTNISMAFQSKGTGGISLSTGSTGTSLVNGTTVTAITATVSGTNYTSIPSVAISAPTTAGGVQATANALMFTSTATIQSGGTGYTNGDVLTIIGGTTGGVVGTYTVTGVSGGVITSVSRTTGSGYSVLPSNPVSTTGGTGTGATLNLTWTVSGFTITNAGSGYVEQPTVTFSGGGGSGAAAYATVGGTPVIKGLGTNLDVFTANANRAFRFYDSNSTGINFWSAANGTTPVLFATGSSNTSAAIITNGTGSVSFQSAGGASTQFVVSHTASAVNYVQVTGGATTADARISAQGSDTNVGLAYSSKGTFFHRFWTNNFTNQQFIITHTANSANQVSVTGSATGAAPSVSASGTDTNIDLALTPKGTGLVRFGTYTAGAPTATGYISIKAADGTTYKVLVGT